MPALLENVSIDGNGTAIDWNGNTPGSLQVFATNWDGATVEIKGSLDDGVTYSSIPQSTGQFTADTFTGIYFGPCKLRATVSGAGVSTSGIYCYVTPG